MQCSLFAMLLLTSLAQGRGDQRLPPEAPSTMLVVDVGMMPIGRPEMITLEMPARLAPPDDAIPQPVRRPRGVDFRAMVVARENFDRWLFADERSQEDRRGRLEDILDAKIVIADLEHKLMLTAQQRAKLRLAGRGDIKRFFDKVDVSEQDNRSGSDKFLINLADTRPRRRIRERERSENPPTLSVAYL
jgi:hypothetical protein